MGDCIPTPGATEFVTKVATTTQTTTLLSESTLVSVQTGSFPSTICTGSGSDRCSVLIITYRITSTSTTFIPTATSTVISQITNIIPQQTHFAQCTSLGTNGVNPFPSGQTQDNNSGPPSTNRAAVIGGVISAVVTLSLSVIAFLMWTLWRKNRAMKAALAEREREEEEVNMAHFLPTPYPFTSPPPGPNVADTASSLTPRNLSSYDYSSARTHQQGVPGLSISSMYSRSPSTGLEPDSATNDIYAQTQTHSLRLSTVDSLTHSIATTQPPGPSHVTTSGDPPERQGMSAGAEAKGREARMRAVNITEGVEVDPAAPPPAYSRETQ